MELKDKNLPLVSIITPSFNQARFIKYTILSVKNQTYPNIEHIIIDGGSSDNTLEILRKYEDTYNMRWISEPDEGQADAINKGFKMANGEIIGWLNSDDCYLKTTAVSKVVKSFSITQADIVYGDNVEIDQDNLILRIRCGIPRFSYKLLLWCDYISQPTVFFKRKVLEKYALDKNLQFAMDYDFWLQLGRAYRFHYLNDIIAAARKHTSCKTVSRLQEVKKEDRVVRRRYKNGDSRVIDVTACLMWYAIHRYQVLKGLCKLQYLYSNNGYAFPVKIDYKPFLILRHIVPFSLMMIKR